MINRREFLYALTVGAMGGVLAGCEGKPQPDKELIAKLRNYSQINPNLPFSDAIQTIRNRSYNPSLFTTGKELASFKNDYGQTVQYWLSPDGEGDLRIDGNIVQFNGLLNADPAISQAFSVGTQQDPNETFEWDIVDSAQYYVVYGSVGTLDRMTQAHDVLETYVKNVSDRLTNTAVLVFHLNFNAIGSTVNYADVGNFGYWLEEKSGKPSSGLYNLQVANANQVGGRSYSYPLNGMDKKLTKVDIILNLGEITKEITGVGLDLAAGIAGRTANEITNVVATDRPKAQFEAESTLVDYLVTQDPETLRYFLGNSDAGLQAIVEEINALTNKTRSSVLQEALNYFYPSALSTRLLTSYLKGYTG